MKLKSILTAFCVIMALQIVGQVRSEDFRARLKDAVQSFLLKNTQTETYVYNLFLDPANSRDDAIRSGLKKLRRDKYIADSILETNVRLLWADCDNRGGSCSTADQNRIDFIEDSCRKQIETSYNVSRARLFRETRRKTTRWLPTRNTIFTQLYYNSESQVDFLSNNRVSLFDDNAAFQSEIIDVYFSIFRISIGTVLSKAETKSITGSEIRNLNNNQIDSLVHIRDSTNKANGTLVKVLSGGGTGVLGLRTTIFKYRQRADKPVTFSSELVGRYSLDLPVAGTSSDVKETYSFWTVGLEQACKIPFKKYSITTFEDISAISAFGRFSVNYVGGSGKFHDVIASTERNFAFTNASFGIEIQNFSIYYTKGIFFDSRLSNNNYSRVTVGISKIF